MSVTAARGFVASGISASLKASGRPDLGLLVSERPATAGGLFTTNEFAAAPVQLSRSRLGEGRARAVLVNSGQANAGTGPQGFADAEALTGAAASALGLEAREVLCCSTGVIGARILTERAIAGIAQAATDLSPNGGPAFARAILTTDRAAKEAEVRAGGCTVGGCAKGAGMISPDLATLLVFLTTDAEADPSAIRHALRWGAGPVWNGVTVDGCTSTNDTVLLMANGASSRALDEFDLAEAVHAVCADLARQVIADAEGASTSMVVQVEGAASDGDAQLVGRAVAGSLLVKTAIFGKDPSPGRILQAIGASGARFARESVEATLARIPVIEAGRIPSGFDPAACAEALMQPEVVIRIRMGDGPGSATALGCDLGYEYVRINAEYTT
ncbi:MAG: bifunctional glutamate N-acetyltransferase/amino-acid acetyltransferase ArgJ [Actinomycetota bacterium]